MGAAVPGRHAPRNGATGIGHTITGTKKSPVPDRHRAPFGQLAAAVYFAAVLNCSSSVDPVMAVTEEVPPWITWVTRSK